MYEKERVTVLLVRAVHVFQDWAIISHSFRRTMISIGNFLFSQGTM